MYNKLVFLLPFLCTLLFTQPATAQNSGKQIALQIYSNFDYVFTEYYGPLDTNLQRQTSIQSARTRLGYFSPAVVLYSENGNFTEFELARLQFNHASEETLQVSNIISGPPIALITGKRTDVFEAAVRLEKGIRFFKQKTDAKLLPYLGFAVLPYVSVSEFVPYITTEFRTFETKIGGMLSVIPRIKLKLHERWFLDLNVPIQLANISLSANRTDNPSLPIRLQRSANFAFNALPVNLLARLGVTCKL